MNETNYNETTNDAGAQEIIGHDGGEMMFRGGMVPYSTECTQDDSTQYTFTIGGGDTLADSDREPYHAHAEMQYAGSRDGILSVCIYTTELIHFFSEHLRKKEE